MTTQLAERELRSVNPATLEVVGSVPTATADDVVAAAERAASAAERWRAEPLETRRDLLRRVRTALVDHQDELAQTITAETGKPLPEAFANDLLLVAEQLRWLERHAHEVLAPRPLRVGIPYLLHKRVRTVYEPLGVVGVIAPWNFPLAIALSQTAAAVAAGNAVVLKPSELSPLTGAWIGRLFAEAGAPKGLVEVVQGDAEVGAALVRAPHVAKIVFTGSPSTGVRVATAAAELLRPVTLEHGSKDPMIVLDDADLERALEGAAWGSFANCGQICVGVERIFVARPLHDTFVEELARRARALRIGRGDEPGTDLGPLVSERQRAHVEDLVAEALEHGADAVTGARRPSLPLPGWFYEPTVIVGAGATARIEQEEVFGPVVTVRAFDTESEAIELANAQPFGLGASVWTRSAERARRIASRLDTGMVWTNDIGWSYGAGAAWGGTKRSGYGRLHGEHGLYELSHIKVVDHDGGRVPVPWWYPYDERAVDGFRGVLETLHGDGVARRASGSWRHRRGLRFLTKRYLGR